MSVSLHLSFNGNAAQAFAYYAEKLGGKVIMSLPYGGSPMAAEIPEVDRGRLMHISMELDGFHLMGADAISTHPYQGSEGFSISLNVPTVERANEVFAILNDGGTTLMPIGPTFWAKAFGITRDRFNITWMINCENPS